MRGRCTGGAEQHSGGSYGGELEAHLQVVGGDEGGKTGSLAHLTILIGAHESIKVLEDVRAVRAVKVWR